MILATLAKFSFIPTTRNNASHLIWRFRFLLVTLALTAGPTLFTTVAENQPGGGGSLILILSITQSFIISIGTTVLFGIMPSSRMCGDWVASKLRKYFASHTFNS